MVSLGGTVLHAWYVRLTKTEVDLHCMRVGLAVEGRDDSQKSARVAAKFLMGV